MMSKIEKLLVSSQHVFTTQDLAILWGMANQKQLWSTIRHYLRTNKLKRLYKGIYAPGNFTAFELAQKLVTPSYLSFYTAIAVHGIVSQLYETIHAMALVSKTISAQSQQFSYHRLRESVFYDPLGIIDEHNYRIAGPERAVCDSLYLVPPLAFDRLHTLNIDLLESVASRYHNKELEHRIKKLVMYIDRQRKEQNA